MSAEQASLTMSSTHTRASSSQVAFEKATYLKVFKHTIVILMLCYVAAYLDRVNVGFAKLQMAQELGFSDAVFGFGAGIFFFGYLLFEVPSNLAMHRIGGKVWIARIMVTWSLISAAFMFVNTPTSFYVLRFLLGAAEAGFFPAVILYLTQWYPPKRRGTVTAIFMSGSAISGLIGAPLSGWVMQKMGHDALGLGLSGWQWMFVIEAAPSLILGVLVFLFLTNTIEEASWLTSSEKNFLRAELAEGEPQADSKSDKLLAVIFDARVLHTSLLYFCIGMGQYGIAFWLPSLVRSSGVVGALNVGVVSAIPFLVGLVAMNLFGRSADRKRERRWHLAFAALLAAVGFTASTLAAQHTTVAIAFLCVAAAGALSCPALFWPIPTAFLTGRRAAAGVAVINSLASMSGFVSPYVIGKLNDSTGTSSAGMFALSAVLVCAALLALAVPARMVNK